jgi:hypothetical protein
MATIVKNFANTGQNFKNTTFNLQRIKRIILVPFYDSSGDENSIADSDSVTKSALQAKCQAANVRNRYYPLPNFKNLEHTPGEAKFFDWDDAEQVYLSTGVDKVKAFLENVDAGPALAKKLMTGWNGSKFGIFCIDEANNFIYMLDSAGTIVKPIPIAGGSFHAKFIPAKADAPCMVEVSFSFDKSMDWGDLRYIQAEDLDFRGTDYDDLSGLYDVTITTSAPATTGFTALIKTDYAIPVTGLTKDDMYLYNVTDSAVVTITSATESTTTPGSYVLVFTAQTAADVLRLNLLAASGFDPADTGTATVPS